MRYSVLLAVLIIAFSLGGNANAQDDTSGTGTGTNQKFGSPRRQLSQEQRKRVIQFLQRRRASRESTGTGNRSGDAWGQTATIDPNKVKVEADVAYGAEPRQKLDVYMPKQKTGPLPIILFVHGGGWHRGNKGLQKEKGINYAENGVVAVVTNYRLAPDVMHPKQIQDIASAFAWVKTHATELGGDPNRIYIMGHSAGAQLVDLLGTNERFLLEKKLSVKDIRGVISLDTASLNLGERLGDGSIEGEMVGDMIVKAFGKDPKVLADASPTLCIHAGKSYPPFLMFYGERRKNCAEQHVRFADAMKAVGGTVELKKVPLSHGEISKEAGTPQAEIFKEVIAFMAKTVPTANQK